MVPKYKILLEGKSMIQRNFSNSFCLNTTWLIEVFFLTKMNNHCLRKINIKFYMETWSKLTYRINVTDILERKNLDWINNSKFGVGGIVD